MMPPRPRRGVPCVRNPSAFRPCGERFLAQVGALLAECLSSPPEETAYYPHPVTQQAAVGGMMDLGFHHRRVHLQLPPAGDFQRSSEVDGPIIQGRHRLGTYLVGPTDEGGLIRSTLWIQAAELPQDDRIADEALGA